MSRSGEQFTSLLFEPSHHGSPPGHKTREPRADAWIEALLFKGRGKTPPGGRLSDPSHRLAVRWIRPIVSRFLCANARTLLPACWCIQITLFWQYVVEQCARCPQTAAVRRVCGRHPATALLSGEAFRARAGHRVWPVRPGAQLVFAVSVASYRTVRHLSDQAQRSGLPGDTLP